MALSNKPRRSLASAGHFAAQRARQAVLGSASEYRLNKPYGVIRLKPEQLNECARGAPPARPTFVRLPGSLFPGWNKGGSGGVGATSNLSWPTTGLNRILYTAEKADVPSGKSMTFIARL